MNILEENIRIIKEITDPRTSRMYQLKYVDLYLLFNKKSPKTSELLIETLEYIRDHRYVDVDNGSICCASYREMIDESSIFKSFKYFRTHMDFLCFIGFLKKMPVTAENEFTKPFSAAIKADSSRQLFKVIPYTEDVLERINSRISLLTASRAMSLDKLADQVESTEEAKTVYSTRDSYYWYDIYFNKVYDYIGTQLDEKGYTTQDEIIENVILNKMNNRSAVIKVLSIYKLKLMSEFKYSRPKKIEKEKYALPDDRWIFTRKSTI